jgi:hypothetical protein
LKEGKKHPGLSRSKAEAAHLDNLLDEALRETFPASDPIAIAIDKPSKGIEPHGLLSPNSPPTAAGPQEIVVSSAPPGVAFFDANLWALRQISDYFDWWFHLLGDRK